MTPTTDITGDLTLSRRLTTGGRALIGGRLTVKGDLEVNGWLRAPNVQGPCKGLYATAEDLTAAHPKPQAGWWALVGSTLPAVLYTAAGERWTTNGGTGGVDNVHLDNVERRLEALEDSTAAEELQDRLESLSAATGSRLDSVESETQAAVAAVERSAGKAADKADAVSSAFDTLCADMVERRAVGSTTPVLDHCKGLGEGRPLYKRSVFSGFGNMAGRVEAPFDTLEVPVLAADWNDNNDPVTDVMVVIRAGGPEGEVLYNRHISFGPIQPGISRTLLLTLAQDPLSFSGELWLDMRFDAPCTIYFCESAEEEGTTETARYYISGRQSMDDKGFKPDPPATWWFMRYRLLRSAGRRYTINDTTLDDVRRRLDLDSLISKLPTQGAPSTPAAAVRLPKRIYAVEGDTLQLFYRGMVEDTLPLLHRPMLCGSRGKAYPEMWEYTPAGGDAGEARLRLSLRDASGSETASAETTLVTVAAPQSPEKPLHVACIGDSLTAGGMWVKELQRRLCATGGSPAGLGLTGIRFGGVRISGDAAWTGFGGWQWHHFTGRGSATGDSGAGDVSETTNPLYDDSLGRISFLKFAREHCGGDIDIVYVLLGWNSLTPLARDHSPILAEARTFARRLHADFPQAHMRLMGLQLPSVDGGTGTSYGAAADGYADLHRLTMAVHRLNRGYAELASEAEFSQWMGYVEVAAQFDTDHSMPSEPRPANTRSAATVRRGTNGVHPSAEGYMQIADAAYRDLCAYMVL